MIAVRGSIWQARVGVTYAAPPLSHEEFIGCLKHGKGGSGGRKGFFTPKLDPNEVKLKNCMIVFHECNSVTQ
jgi:hypothetical protein